MTYHTLNHSFELMRKQSPRRSMSRHQNNRHPPSAYLPYVSQTTTDFTLRKKNLDYHVKHELHESMSDD